MMNRRSFMQGLVAAVSLVTLRQRAEAALTPTPARVYVRGYDLGAVDGEHHVESLWTHVNEWREIKIPDLPETTWIVEGVTHNGEPYRHEHTVNRPIQIPPSVAEFSILAYPR